MQKLRTGLVEGQGGGPLVSEQIRCTLYILTTKPVDEFLIIYQGKINSENPGGNIAGELTENQ